MAKLSGEKSFAIILLVLLLAVSPLGAQDETPTKVTDQNRSGELPFSGFVGTDIEKVMIATGNPVVNIPFVSVPGRGMPFNFGLWYDARFLTTVVRTTPFNHQKWNTEQRMYITSQGLWSVAQPGISSTSYHSDYCYQDLANPQHTGSIDGGKNYVYHDANGGKHPLSTEWEVGTCFYLGGWDWQYFSSGPDLTGQGAWSDFNTGFRLADGTRLAGGGVDGSGGAPPEIGAPPSILQGTGTFIDSNGNIKGEFAGGLDTLGRSLVTRQDAPGVIQYVVKDSGGTSRTYTVNYTNFTLTTSFGVSGPYGHIGEYGGQRQKVTSIVLPNNTSYGFQYDSFGFITQITLPTGAAINYGWQKYSNEDCTYRYVSSRTVTVNGQVSQWTFSHVPDPNSGPMMCMANQINTPVQVTMTDPANNQSVYIVDRGNVKSAKFYAGAAGGTLVREHTITYHNFNDYPNADLFFPIEIKTKLEDGLTSKKEFTYDTFTFTQTSCFNDYISCSSAGPQAVPRTSSRGNVKEIREYDWGSGSPGPLLRRTKKEYLHETNADYRPPNGNIVSKVISSTIYDALTDICKGVAGKCAQTQYEYDQYVGDNPMPSLTTSVPQRASGFGTAFTLRGNVTRVKRWRNTDDALLTTTYTYDELGNIRAIKDPMGHSITYVYDDSFANTHCPSPAGMNAQAWVSEVKNALHHRIQVTRFPCTGLVQARKDENDIVNARAGTTFSYDLMNRLLQKILPDQGQESFNYNLDPVPPATTTTKKISTTPLLNLESTTNFDGLGRGMQTMLTDPDCGSAPVKVDTTYDVLGRKKKESNPYCGSLAGETETEYDALGRVRKVIPPDGTPSTNHVVTDYAGNTTTVTDQAGKQRRSYSDALGRLIRVDEPGEGMTTGSPAAPATASVNIVGPLGVVQTQPGAQSTGWVRINGSERSTQVTIETNCRIEWNPAGYEEWVCDYVPVTEWDFGIITLTVNGVSKSVNYGQNSTAANLASALAGQVNADGNYPVTAVVVSGNTINLTSRVAGASTNYALNITSQTQNTSYFSGTSFPVEKSGPNLTGGADPQFATDSGNVWVQIGSYTGNATYASGSTPTSVANTLAAALTTHSQANASVVTISSSQARIDLSAKQVGVAGNSMQWAGGATSNQAGLFNPPSIRPSTASGNFSGGADEVLPQPNGIFSLDTPLITNYTYDALDNLTCVEQRGKVSGSGCAAPESSDATSPWRVRRFTYNSLGQLLSAKNPESGLITFTYDNAGNLKSKTSPAPNVLPTSPPATQTISYCYDVLHRMTKKFFIANPVCTDTAPITFFYDQTSHNGLTNITNGIGRRTGMNDQSGATAWKYDPMGRPLKERRTIGTVTKETNYTYNFDGSLKSVSSPGTPTLVVEYSYNAAGRAIAATEGSISYVSAVKYTPAGAPCSLTNDVSIVSTFTFNSRLQPVRMHATTTGAPATPCGTISSAGTILDFEYNFNAGTANNGNVIGITNNRATTRSQAFTYDELNRLNTAQTTSNLWGNSYVYDAWGNLLQKNPVTGKLEGELLQVTVNGKNQMETSYCYDIAGNLVKQAACPLNPLAIDYTYDEENQLETAGGVTYTYDGDGKRVKKSNGTLYWYGASGQILKETDLAGNNPKDYIFFNGDRIARRDSATVIHYYFSDHLGSSNVVTNKTGLTIEEESDFYPFGGERVITNTLADQNYKFTGKERDSETNLDYFGARYYAFNFGRFVTPDWSETPATVPYADSGNPQTLNLYSYSGNNPTTYSDANGHCWPASECADNIQAGMSSMSQSASSWAESTGSPTLAYATTALVGTGTDLVSAVTGGVLRTGEASGAAMDSGTFLQRVDAAASDTLGGAGTTLLLAAPVLGATSGTGTASVTQNAARGAASEARVLEEIGAAKNTKSVSGSEGRSIPDFQNSKVVGEIKDAKTVSNTRQIRIQREAAQKSGREHQLITGEKTKVTKNASRGTKVIRRKDLGPGPK